MGGQRRCPRELSGACVSSWTEYDGCSCCGVGWGREVTMVREGKPRIKPGWVMLKKLMLLIDL